MDYLVFSSLQHAVALLLLVLSYDIFCQWSKNLGLRMQGFPDEIKLPASVMKVQGAIPTFHLRGHGSDCYGRYGFPCLPGVGCTCGEGIEPEWAAINLVATSVREMSPAGRQETLNSHWSFWNSRKIVSFGAYFREKLIEAVRTRDSQSSLFTKFTASFKPEVIQEWDDAVQAWEASIDKWQHAFYRRDLEPKKKDDPYSEPETGMTLAQVQRELLKEEGGLRDKGVIVESDCTASTMLAEGLELEDHLCVMLADRSQHINVSTTTTSRSLSSAEQKLLNFRSRVTKWRSLQHWHMSFLVPTIHEKKSGTLVNEGLSEEEDMESFSSENDLLLPSFLTPDLAKLCPNHLKKMEACMRFAQLGNGINEIKRLLRVCHNLLHYKKLHVVGTGQGPNTRARALINCYTEKIDRCIMCYKHARVALLTLDPTGLWITQGWQSTFQEIHMSDLKFPSSTESTMLGLLDTAGSSAPRHPHSDGQREISWIWFVAHSPVSKEDLDSEMDASMQIEWVKARARVRHWEEEVLLLAEEMRRVVAWLDWKSGKWKLMADAREIPPDLKSGLRGYTFEQAHMLSAMASAYARRWIPVLIACNLPCEWAKQFSPDLDGDSNMSIESDSDNDNDS